MTRALPLSCVVALLGLSLIGCEARVEPIPTRVETVDHDVTIEHKKTIEHKHVEPDDDADVDVDIDIKRR